jgi:hypothetical protein
MSEISIEAAVAWLEQHAPDAVADLRLLGKMRFGGDTPGEFTMAAHEREKRALEGAE